MARAARIEYDGALYERFPSTGHGEKGPASYSCYPQQPYNSYHPFCLTRTRVQNTRGCFFNAFANIINYYSVPYSNLGTSNWVIYDAELGYRLNPKRPNINSRSVRHEEIVLPKPQGTYRIIGQVSVPAERCKLN